MDIQYTNGPGGACPVQAEGTINGYPFYFRSRYGSWALHVASSPSGDPLDDDAWVVTEDYPIQEGERGSPRFSAGWAPDDDCIAFIERHAETFAKTLL